MAENTHNNNCNNSHMDSYDDISVHELMLKDRPRTLAYMHFFERHKEYFKGKVVMDVGSGTGILSMFAARAGASKVYAVEASNIRQLSEKIIIKNNLSDVIEVLGGRVEEVVMEGKVDVIVSEWMGFYLLHESMLSSVIVARNRFLKEDGIILPSSARLYIAPVSLQSIRRSYDASWKDLYGFNFSPIVDEMFESRMKQHPQTFTISPSDLLSPPSRVVVLDMKYADVTDLDKFDLCLSFKMQSHDVLRGLTLWFDVEFSLGDDDEDEEEEEEEDEGMNTSSNNQVDHSPNANNSAAVTENNSKNKQKKNNDNTPNHPTISPTPNHPTTSPTPNHPTTSPIDQRGNLTLSTSPMSPPTHWKQTTILLPSPLLMAPGGSFQCRMKMHRGGGDDDPEGRRYKITLELPDDDEEEEEEVDDDDDDDVCVIDVAEGDFIEDEDGDFDKNAADLILKAVKK